MIFLLLYYYTNLLNHPMSYADSNFSLPLILYSLHSAAYAVCEFLVASSVRGLRVL